MKFLFALSLLLATNAHALTFAESAASAHKNSATGYLGFTGGGIAFGADYEMQMHRTYSVGGYLKVISKDEEVGASDGIGGFAAGGFVRTHFYKRTWDLYVSPGFGVFSMSNDGAGTSFGPSMAFGMLYQYNRDLAFGGEVQQLYGWFGDTKGPLKDTFLASVHYGF